MKRQYKTLILNSDMIPLQVKSWQGAITLLLKKKATQIDFYADDFIVDGHSRHYPIPAVIMLNHYVRRDYRKAALTKANVFSRDLYQCQYCLKELKSSQLTLDHVIPKSKWKWSTSSKCWTNIVTACFRCNALKADKTCREADMFPAKIPVQPGYDEVFFGMHFHGRIENAWIPWLRVFDNFKKLYPVLSELEEMKYHGSNTVY
jgi:5-methylcytosine-specific restriction endonuclease McrA